MSNELSTNELFHYTDLDGLSGIISNGFYPKYNFEFTYLSDLFDLKAINLPLPMVCFCDIPLQSVKNHSNKYGECAIGLKKSWGEKYGLNPVFYINQNSIVADSFAAIGSNISKYKSSMILEGSDNEVFMILGTAFKAFSHLSCFTKQFERAEDKIITVMGNRFELKKGKFYDEREWRYIPIRNEEGDIRHIDRGDFFDPIKLEQHNLEIRKYTLPFELDDISHIIYKEDVQLSSIIEVLRKRFNIDEITINEKVVFLKQSDL